GSGTSLGEAAIPVDHFGRDLARLRGAPRHHRRHPSSLLEAYRPHADRAEPPRLPRGIERGPVDEGELDLARVARLPHRPVSSARARSTLKGLQPATRDHDVLDLARAFVDA